MKKVLLLGLGNEIISDDAIGIIIVRKIKEKSHYDDFLDIKESSEMGLSLLDLFNGYHTVVIVDAIQTGKVEVGYLHEFNEGDLKIISGTLPHYIGVPEVLAIGKTLGLDMPKQIKIFGVEVKDPFTISTQITKELEEKLPFLVEKILEYISKLISSASPRH